MKEFTVGGRPGLQKAFAEVLGVEIHDYEKQWPVLFAGQIESLGGFFDQREFEASDHFDLPAQWDEAMSYARRFYGMEQEAKPPLPESWGDLPQDDSYILVTKKSDTYDAFCMLYDLRLAYWNAHDGWRPDWTDINQGKHAVFYYRGEPTIGLFYFEMQRFLVFPTKEQAQHFLKHHHKLIEQARELL